VEDPYTASAKHRDAASHLTASVVLEQQEIPLVPEGVVTT